MVETGTKLHSKGGDKTRSALYRYISVVAAKWIRIGAFTLYIWLVYICGFFSLFFAADRFVIPFTFHRIGNVIVHAIFIASSSNVVDFLGPNIISFLTSRRLAIDVVSCLDRSRYTGDAAK